MHIAVQEVEALRVADDVDDLRPVDEDQPVPVEEDVVCGQVTVRPAVQGKSGEDIPGLLEKRWQGVAFESTGGEARGC